MLHTNGGLLELSKCYWLLVAWKWVRGIPRLKTKEEAAATMILRQTETNNDVTIPRKTVKEAPKVLGCHVAADGSWAKEVGKWTMEGIKFAKKVNDANFTRTCGSKVYPSLWISRLRYIAQVVCFTQEQSHQVNVKVVKACLPAAGYNRNFPRKVVYGPQLYGGMEWETCRSLQILEKIKFFITHVRRQDRLGKMLQILVESLQLQSGLIEPILETKIEWKKWVDTTWIHNLREGLDQINGSLVTSFHKIPTPRQYDRSIMEIFATRNLSAKVMNSLNRCRVYLQVIFVSDIANFEGNRICKEIFETNKNRKSTLLWARQVRPTLSDRKIWKKHITRLCIIDDILITTLGRWKCAPHQIWPFMRRPDNTALLRYRNGSQNCLRSYGKGKYIKIGRELHSLESGIPVQCATTPIGYTEKTSQVSDLTYARINNTIFDMDNKALQKTMGHVKCQNLGRLKNQWREGSEWLMGTDGGLKYGIGTTGVSLHNIVDNREMCSSQSAEKCDFNNLHSTREEVRAALAAEILITECNKHFGKSEQHITLVCDNTSALNKLEHLKEDVGFNSPLAAEMELLMELARMKKENANITREFKWVKSHQKKNAADLTEYEKVNERADELATESRELAQQELFPTIPKQIFEGGKVTLTVNNAAVTKYLKETITMALYGGKLRKYMEIKYVWTKETFDDVDWSAFGASLAKLHGLHKVTVHKLIHFWQPTNSITQRNQKRVPESAKCTECEEIDNQFHYVKCKSDYFVEARKFAWKRFINRMKYYSKEETMVRVMWIGIQNWIFDDFDEALPRGNELTNTQYDALCIAYKKQNEIGWDQFLVGHISKAWSDFYRLRIQSSDESEGKITAYTRNLISAIWTYTLNVWKSHNEAVHGKKNKYSNRDVKSIQQCIIDIYDSLQDKVSEEEKWLFREESKIRITHPVPQMIGWLERVLLCFESEDNAQELVNRAKSILRRMCFSSIYDQK